MDASRRQHGATRPELEGSPSPLKIQPEEYVETPSSSATASPAESCGKYDAVRQLKPWTASLASSVDSSEASDAEDDAEEEEPEGSIVVESSAKASARSTQMQTHLRGMHRRLEGLQRLIQEAGQPARLLRTHSQGATANTISCLLPETSADVGESADLRVRAPLLLKEETLELVSASPGICAKEPPPGKETTDREDEQVQENVSLSDDEAAPTMATLLNQIEALQAQLKETADENQQLQKTVHRLEEENVRLQVKTAFNPRKGSCRSIESGSDQDSSGDEGGEAVEDHDGGISRLTTAIFGQPSAFQMVMEEDLMALKNHERCQHKLHELWDTVRTLRTFVETFELERDAMRIQRDEAIAEAERADTENVKLASSSNPQQKIRYLQQVKKDNQALRRKNRALNTRIAKQARKLIHQRNGCSVLENDGEASRGSVDPATLDETLLQDELDATPDLPFDRTGEEVLRGMRGRSGFLELRLERLRLARQELPPEVDVDDDSGDEASASVSELPTDSTAVPLPAPPTSVTSAR